MTFSPRPKIDTPKAKDQEATGSTKGDADTGLDGEVEDLDAVEQADDEEEDW